MNPGMVTIYSDLDMSYVEAPQVDLEGLVLGTNFVA